MAASTSNVRVSTAIPSADFSDSDGVFPTFDEIGCAANEETCGECGGEVLSGFISCSVGECSKLIFHDTCVIVDDDDDFEDGWICSECSSGLAQADEARDDNPTPTTTTEETKTKKTKKKPAVKRPAPKYTKDHLVQNFMSYVLLVIAAVKVHKVYSNKRYPNTAPLQAAADSVKRNLENSHQATLDFFTTVRDSLWTTVTSADHRQLSNDSTNAVLSDFHQFRVSPIRQQWRALFHSLEIPYEEKPANVLLQFILRSLLAHITKERNHADMPCNTELPNSELRRTDHQIIAYIAGFIPFALLKKFRKTKSAIFIAVLESWRLNESKGETFVSYVKEWVDKQSRGYLFQPNWDLHVFFRTLEYVGRQYLHKGAIGNYKNSNIKELLMTVFNSNKVVRERWIVLMGNHELSDSESEKLLKIILAYWVKIRCTAYVNVYIDLRKQDDKGISKKGEKGLRKNVDKN